MIKLKIIYPLVDDISIIDKQIEKLLQTKDYVGKCSVKHRTMIFSIDKNNLSKLNSIKEILNKKFNNTQYSIETI